MILWSSCIITVFWMYRREQQLVYKSLYASGTQNLVAAYRFSLLPGIWWILNKVLLSPASSAHPKGASVADGVSRYPAVYSPVCPCTSSSFIENLWQKSKTIHGNDWKKQNSMFFVMVRRSNSKHLYIHVMQKKIFHDKRIWMICSAKKSSFKWIYFEINIICLYSYLY